MTGKASDAGLFPVLLLGLMLDGCVTLSTDASGASLRIALRGSTPQNAPPGTGGTVCCDLRIIEVSDGTVAASGGGESAPDKMAEFAKALSRKLKGGMMVKGESISVVSLRNRSGTPQGKVVADELADKVSGALVDTGWFEVKERTDLRGILNEQDLETAGIVKKEDVKDKLAGVKYIVIGGVTVTEAEKKP